jgi:CRP/FNR family transcriptional regulator, cyclic AMP receptor protein
MLSSERKAKRTWKAEQLSEWSQHFKTREHYKTGEIVFSRGDSAGRLYLIISGEVELPQIGERLRAGDLFGEIGLFSNDRRRTQTIRTATDVDLRWIDRSQLHDICARDPSLSLYLLRLAATRLAAERKRT